MKKFNFDIQFMGEGGARGMWLDTNGDLTAYDAQASRDAREGTWMILPSAVLGLDKLVRFLGLHERVRLPSKPVPSSRRIYLLVRFMESRMARYHGGNSADSASASLSATTSLSLLPSSSSVT